MEKFQEGIILLGTGIVVVMTILSLLALSVGLLVRIEDKLRERDQAKKEAARAAAEPGRVPAEIVAVIGLALHQYFSELDAKKEVFEIELAANAAWVTSGRRDIMEGRNLFQARPRPRR